ncbi:RusA family crossover junction endodeoxyribonuclease [Jiella sonneratiae]|uniref:RusA family crossover junction endodeoxyribonuclease n=1 Tax=Jiella sonneratiae TaxID=2816856 RepID=A0ABS3J4V0_9HYPH|nr:RusA family crossover junction endodeoxyribonuclease [Jiella sonneratiae]MBO0903968.1 RusA family crossover junction endodeoxyribonuclease [Jiella sonneratiae]
MALEPPLPLEFIVHGTPTSLQGSARSRDEWQRRVRRAALAGLPVGGWLLSQPLAATIYIFPAAPLAGDIDNRVKHILDAMTRVVYLEDAQIHRIVVQKFEPDAIFQFANASQCLAEALMSTDPVVYVRITDDLHEELR